MNEAEYINEICALRTRLAEVEAERDQLREELQASEKWRRDTALEREYEIERRKAAEAELAEVEAEYARCETVIRTMNQNHNRMTARLAEVEAERDEALELAEEVIPYAGEYFNEKWALTERLDELKVRAAARGERNQ